MYSAAEPNVTACKSKVDRSSAQRLADPTVVVHDEDDVIWRAQPAILETRDDMALRPSADHTSVSIRSADRACFPRLPCLPGCDLATAPAASPNAITPVVLPKNPRRPWSIAASRDHQPARVAGLRAKRTRLTTRTHTRPMIGETNRE